MLNQFILQGFDLGGPLCALFGDRLGLCLASQSDVDWP